MKKIFNFLSILLMASSALMITSCGDDTDNPVAGSPTITATAFATSIDAGSKLEVTVTGTKNSSLLKSLSFEEDGIVLDGSKIVEKSTGTTLPSGTVLLQGTSTDNFSTTFLIEASKTAGSHVYKFVLTDENSKSDAAQITVTLSGLSTATSDTLYNIQGPYKGGLNLATGKSIAKGSDASNQWAGAHIVDNGNNTVGSEHFWNKQIKSWDNAIIKPLSDATLFNSVASESDIKAAYDASVSTLTFDLAEGKVFTAFRDNQYFIVKVTKILDDGPSTASSTKNKDYSIYEIKQKD